MFSTIRAAVAAETWAIHRVWFEAALESAGNRGFSPQRRIPSVKGTVAVIPIHGMITQRGSVFDDIFGGTSTQAFEGAFSRAMSSDRISAVVLDIDSPGGTTSGVQAAAERVFAARGTKPVVAVSNSLMASAAYWIGSAADTVVGAPGSETGSIGVFRMHQDLSKAMEEMGVTTTFIAEPENKVEGNPFSPLSDDAMQHQKDQVHETFLAFNGAVAKHRGLTSSKALDQFGRGRSYKADQARERHLIDRVATLDKVLSELGVGKSATVTEAAEFIVEGWESGEVVEPRLRYKEVERRRLSLDSLGR